MKIYSFVVVFTSHAIQKVLAGNRKEAVILAQGEQIKAGLEYNVEFVKKEGKII